MQKLCGGYAVLRTKAINEANVYVECIYVEVMRGLCAGYAEVAALQWRYTKDSMHSLCGGSAEVIYGSDPPFRIKTCYVEVMHKLVVQQAPRYCRIHARQKRYESWWLCSSNLPILQTSPCLKGGLSPSTPPSNNLSVCFRMLTYAYDFKFPLNPP